MIWMVLAWAVLWVVPSTAAVRRVSLEECVRDADRVFVGTVSGISTRWGDSGKMIWTDYFFQVEEVWKGKGEDYLTVSVAGGTVGNQSILLSHVPTFDLHATYVVFAYDNARLVAEGVVGVEQGLFREVTDASSGQKVILDDYGYLMEKGRDGCIRRGRLTRPLEGGLKAEILTAEELKAQQSAFEKQYDHPAMPRPVYRDASGAPMEAPPLSRSESAAKPMAVPGQPLTRDDLRAYTFKVLSTPQGEASGAPCAGGEGRPL
jgi:hypothetical protein